MRAPLTRRAARRLPDRSNHRCYPTQARQSCRTKGWKLWREYRCAESYWHNRDSPEASRGTRYSVLGTWYASTRQETTGAKRPTRNLDPLQEQCGGPAARAAQGLEPPPGFEPKDSRQRIAVPPSPQPATTPPGRKRRERSDPTPNLDPLQENTWGSRVHTRHKTFEPPPGFEPGTPSLPWRCSATELRRHVFSCASGDPDGRKSGGRPLVPGEGFEPPKVITNRFTVCSLWPLGYPGRVRFARG